MFAGMLDDRRQTLFVEAVLRGRVRDHNTFPRLVKGVDSDRETIRMGLGETP